MLPDALEQQNSTKVCLPFSIIEADHAKIKPMKHVFVANDIKIDIQ